MKALLDAVLDRRDLTEAQAEQVVRALASGDVSPAVAGAMLGGLRAKGETAAELRGFARGMRSMAVQPALGAARRLVDTCGTGGDGSHSLNLSTGAALLAAGCGAEVVKHGNRSVSSRSGSADVLEALGVPVGLPASRVGDALDASGFTFLFAPNFHPAMKAIMPVRRAMGVRTVFNLLGPLTNPARPAYQVIGAWSAEAAGRIAEAASGLEIERVFVVHGAHGWDEATPCGPYLLFDVRPGSVERTVRDPADAGIPPCAESALKGGEAEDNARRLGEALAGRDTAAHRDALALGAALALEVSGVVASAAEGVMVARAALADGRAAAVLERLRGVDAGG